MNWLDDVSFERKALRAFLAMPSCPVKEALGQLMLRVASQVERAGCAHAQADGLPCGDLEPDCPTCSQLELRLRRCLEIEVGRP